MVDTAKRMMLVVASEAVLFAMMTVLMTWPLVFQIDQAVIGWVGDNFYFTWLIGWFQQALLEYHQSPLVVPQLNYPEGWQLAYNEVTPLAALLALPVSLADGPTLGYNFILLLSFILSGLGVAWWVARLTQQRAAGVIAGTLFAFVPYRMSHLLGHLNLMGTQWLPFYFLNLSALLTQRTWSWKTICLTATFLVLIGYTSQYYLYMTLIMSAIWIAGYVLLVDQKAAVRFEFWRRLIVSALVALPWLVLALLPYLQLAAQGHLPSRTFEEVRIWSASPTDYFLPWVRHFLWGVWIERHFDRSLWIEASLSVGVLALVFAFYALLWRRPGQTPPGVIELLALASLSAFLLSLGTDLHWFGQPVIVDVPAFVQRWHPYPKTFIPLPGYFLFKFLPFYASMRIWMRYGIFVSLFMSVLAGIGVAGFLRLVNHRAASMLTMLLVLLVLFEFFPAPQLISPVRGRPVDLWLRVQPGAGAVVEFPFWQVALPEHTYYTLIHNKPFVGGFFGAFATPQFRQIQPVLEAFPDRASVTLLRQLGVQWVLIDAIWYEDFAQIQQRLEALGLRFVVKLNGQHVYELK